MSFGRGLAKDSLIYGGADLVTKAVAFFSFPLLATALSPRDYGSLELIMTLIGIAGLVVGCGLNNSVQRFYWDSSVSLDHRPSLVTTGMVVQSFFGLMLFLCLAAVLFCWGNALVSAKDFPFSLGGLYVAAALVVFGQLMQYIQDVLRLHFAPGRFFLLAVLSRCLTIAAAVYAVVYLHKGLDGFLVAQLMAYVLFLPVGLLLIKKDLVFNFDVERAREIIRFGYPFVFAGIAYWLFGAIDRWMLAGFATLEEAGIYSVAFRFSTLPLFFSIAFAQAWSPFIIKIKSDHPESYKAIYCNVFLYFLYVMLIAAGGVALFSGELIGFLMPSGYAGAAIPLIFLCFSVVIQSTTQITVIGISIERKTHYISRFSWIAVAINVLLNFLLIPSFGAVGAAISMGLSYLSLTIMYGLTTQKIHPLPLAFRPLSVLSVLGGVVLMASLLLHSAEFNWSIVSIKIMLALACMTLGAFALPWSRRIWKFQ